MWLIAESRPIAAITDESPISSGIPAATSVPKTTRRIASVIGIAVYSARLKSSVIDCSSARCALAPPNCSTRKPGLRASTCATASSTGSTSFVASSSTSEISKRTSVACRSSEMTGAATSDTPGCAATASVTSATTARKRGSPARCASVATSTLSSASSASAPASMISSARWDSPTPTRSGSRVFVPSRPPATAVRTTNAIQPAIAVRRWPALQRPMRAARLVDGMRASVLRGRRAAYRE
jgi:hypothetical protein